MQQLNCFSLASSYDLDIYQVVFSRISITLLTIILAAIPAASAEVKALAKHHEPLKII